MFQTANYLHACSKIEYESSVKIDCSTFVGNLVVLSNIQNRTFHLHTPPHRLSMPVKVDTWTFQSSLIRNYSFEWQDSATEQWTISKAYHKCPNGVEYFNILAAVTAITSHDIFLLSYALLWILLDQSGLWNFMNFSNFCTKTTNSEIIHNWKRWSEDNLRIKKINEILMIQLCSDKTDIFDIEESGNDSKFQNWR